MRDNYEQVTTDLSLSPPQIDEAEHFITDQTFRLRAPPTPLEGLGQINYVLDQRDMDRIIEQFPSNDILPSTNWTPQPPTLIRNEQSHS